MHKDIRVRLVSEVALDRLVGAIGVTDQDLKALFDHRIEARFYLGRKSRNLT
jgi:hypothetical protein